SPFGGHPERIIAKRLPGGVSRRLALVREDVDERVVRLFAFVHRRPVPKVDHAVLLEQSAGVLAKAAVEILQSAGSGGVSAQLEKRRLTGFRRLDFRRI